MKKIKNQIRALQKYDRLTNYLSATQVFLKDNVLLERDLNPEDIKSRLLGHWGTCPGISFVYSNINRMIQLHEDRKFAYIVGPGHGFPAFQSNLFVEGSLSNFYPKKIPYSRAGLEEVVENFSTPYGYPSHLNPESPGVILEGGELGYSLSVAGGTVLDNKNLITVALIGDGESESGPLAAAWNINKFISPKSDGAVLPVLHLNEYKISGPTIFGRMDDREIRKYFEGLGYTPFFIDAKKKNFYGQGVKVFDAAMKQIKTLQKKARDGKEILKPNWPVVILKSPKGMGCIAEIDGKKMEDNHYAHQILFSDQADLAQNPEHLQMLQKWLKSYKIEKLISFEKNGKFTLDPEIQSLIPAKNRRIGMLREIYGGTVKKKLKLPTFHSQFVEQKRGEETGKNAMHEAGKFLRDVMYKNKNVRLFSPDETYSNKLSAVFEATHRAWQWPTKKHDLDLGHEGKVVEILSEHTLFGMMWGYTLTGRYGFFATYEAFAQIIASMADQYVKFVKASRDAPFRKPVPSMNVVLSSLLERQDHNGFSHQNPSFIASSLDRDREITNVYFPADKNLNVLAFSKCLESTNALNVIVAGKKMTRTWLTEKEAKKQADDEIMIWDFLSDKNPDLVVVTAGDYVTEETVIGLKLFRQKFPKLKVRFVNIFKLDVLAEENARFSQDEILTNFLTKKKGIVFNFHGYPETVKKLLFDFHLSDRIIVNGYRECGSTTSPFDMKARNGLSRFHLIENLARLAAKQKLISPAEYKKTADEMKKKLAWEKNYIKKNKIDPREIKTWNLEK